MPPDAAALPSLPDIPPWKDRRPYSVGGNMHSASARLSRQNGTLFPKPKYPNIKDLQDQAALLDVNENTSVSIVSHKVAAGVIAHLKQQIDILLRTAAEAIEQAKILTEDEKPDKAYVQYLRASEITINIIPHHPDYKTTVNQRPGWYKEFAGLMMVCFRPLLNIQCDSGVRLYARHTYSEL